MQSLSSLRNLRTHTRTVVIRATKPTTLPRTFVKTSSTSQKYVTVSQVEAMLKAERHKQWLASPVMTVEQVVKQTLDKHDTDTMWTNFVLGGIVIAVWGGVTIFSR